MNSILMYNVNKRIKCIINLCFATCNFG